MADKGNSQSRRAALHQRSEPFESKFSFSILSLALNCNHDSPSFVFSLDLLPEEIFGSKEVPQYIPSDSSVEEEDAMPE
jgi:hypothetical protein